MTLICGMLGLPPVNGVLPQAPLHTRSLCSKKKQAGKGGDKKGDAEMGGEAGGDKGPASTVSLYCHETRVSNLMQAVMVMLCMLVGSEFLNNVPTSIIWAFFAFMSLESLPGNQFFDRVQIIMSDKKRRKQFLNTHHAVYLESVKFSKIVQFTLIQVFLLVGIWAITVWTGLFGISFPLWIMALVPFRLYILPKYVAICACRFPPSPAPLSPLSLSFRGKTSLFQGMWESRHEITEKRSRRPDSCVWSFACDLVLLGTFLRRN